MLFPLLTSAFIAVDPATKENGCMQVIPHSHELGRIDHLLSGDQAGANKDRVTEILKRLPLVHVEMEPGDTLFSIAIFFTVPIRTSQRIRAGRSICCYNAARNNPYKESHHPRYTPLQKVPDSAIREAALRRFADSRAEVSWLGAEAKATFAETFRRSRDRNLPVLIHNPKVEPKRNWDGDAKNFSLSFWPLIPGGSVLFGNAEAERRECQAVRLSGPGFSNASPDSYQSV